MNSQSVRQQVVRIQYFLGRSNIPKAHEETEKLLRYLDRHTDKVRIGHQRRNLHQYDGITSSDKQMWENLYDHEAIGNAGPPEPWSSAYWTPDYYYV